MIFGLWITLLGVSFLLIFLGLYENNFFSAPNYILLFLGFSFIFLLSINLIETDVQIKNGFNETDIVTQGGNQTDITRTFTYKDYGEQTVGFFLAFIGIAGAILTFLHYKTPKRMRGIGT